MTVLPDKASSNSIPIKSGESIQKSVLGPALKLACLVTLAAAITAIPAALQTNNWLLVTVFSVLSFWSLISAFISRISASFQTNGLLLTLFLAGFGELLSPNAMMDAKVIFTGLVIVAIIFHGIRYGILTALVSLFTVAITGGVVLALQSSNAIPNYSEQLAIWIISSATFGTVLAFVTGLIAYFSKSELSALKKGLAEQKETSKQVKELDNALQLANKNLKRSERAFDSTDLFAQQFLNDDSADHTLQKAIQFIKDEFDYYFVAAYLVDEKKEFAIVRAVAGLPGALQLVPDQHIQLSNPGNLSYAIDHAEIRLIPNLREEQNFNSDLLLPDALSELTLPIIYQNKVMGAIDIQSNQANAFSPIELKALKTYTNQVVIAFQKARLNEELKKSQDELTVAFRQFTQQTWQKTLKKGNRKFSIRYRQNNLEKEVPQSAETKQAISQGETVVISNLATLLFGKPSTSIAIPIRLRDQIIGVLNLKVEASELPRDMMPLIESISNRMALALENARLMEEIQMKADREHLVGEISTKIRSSPNVEQVLRTAVSEIGLSLGASEVMIHLHSDQ